MDWETFHGPEALPWKVTGSGTYQTHRQILTCQDTVANSTSMFSPTRLPQRLLQWSLRLDELIDANFGQSGLYHPSILTPAQKSIHCSDNECPARPHIWVCVNAMPSVVRVSCLRSLTGPTDPSDPKCESLLASSSHLKEASNQVKHFQTAYG